VKFVFTLDGKQAFKGGDKTCPWEYSEHEVTSPNHPVFAQMRLRALKALQRANQKGEADAMYWESDPSICHPKQPPDVRTTIKHW
jgi:hypothetical protein